VGSSVQGLASYPHPRSTINALHQQVTSSGAPSFLHSSAAMSVTGANLESKFDSTLRRRSIGVIEINAPDGRRKTIDLSTLSDADRQLAEKFGYKPGRGVPPGHARHANESL